jgi:hypothetical protein
MTIYRGDTPDWKPRLSHMSRYGIPAIFFTTDEDLAELYAQYHGSRKLIGKGVIYKATLINGLAKIDFEHMTTYSYYFRNLILYYYHEKMKGIHITNAVDYPDPRMKTSKSSSIIVIYDASIITDLSEHRTIQLHNE